MACIMWIYAARKLAKRGRPGGTMLRMSEKPGHAAMRRAPALSDSIKRFSCVQGAVLAPRHKGTSTVGLGGPRPRCMCRRTLVAPLSLEPPTTHEWSFCFHTRDERPRTVGLGGPRPRCMCRRTLVTPSRLERPTGVGFLCMRATTTGKERCERGDRWRMSTRRRKSASWVRHLLVNDCAVTQGSCR